MSINIILLTTYLFSLYYNKMIFTTQKINTQRIIFYTILIVMVRLHFCNSKMTDIHTSSHSLQKLMRSEIEFKDQLYEFMNSYNNTSIVVKNFIDQSYSNCNTGLNLNDYLSNPLNTFGLMKRTTYDLNNLLQRLKKNKSVQDLRIHSKIKKLIDDIFVKFPSMEDFYESCLSIALIQEAYNLNITDLMNGLVRVKDNSGIR